LEQHEEGADTLDAILIQLSASALSLTGQWFYGNKSKWGPILGLSAQVPWWIIMVTQGLWGLLPVNIFTGIIHARNLWKWIKE
jgi:hypothetical protein